MDKQEGPSLIKSCHGCIYLTSFEKKSSVVYRQDPIVIHVARQGMWCDKEFKIIGDTAIITPTWCPYIDKK